MGLQLVGHQLNALAPHMQRGGDPIPTMKQEAAKLDSNFVFFMIMLFAALVVAMAG